MRDDGRDYETPVSEADEHRTVSVADLKRLRASEEQAFAEVRASYPVLRVIHRLEGRRDMNLRTADTHPDLLARVTAKAVADAYQQAADDLAELLPLPSR